MEIDNNYSYYNKTIKNIQKVRTHQAHMIQLEDDKCKILATIEISYICKNIVKCKCYFFNHRK